MIAERDVTKLHSINAVDNQLQIQKLPGTPSLTDAEITSSIKAILGCNVDIRASAVDLSVDTGIVHLTGTTDSYWKKAVSKIWYPALMVSWKLRTRLR